MLYGFDDCKLDTDRLLLSRSGEVESVEPQVFDLIVYLIENRGRVVPKVELLDELWGDRFVSESALTTRVKSARQAVGDDGTRQSVIRTAHGKGYEFVATVEEFVGADSEEPTPQRPSRLPAAARALIGRATLLSELTEHVEQNRLVTLVGPAGVGKTALAYELARSVEDHYPDGVFAVELVTVLDSDATAEALATALDAHPRQSESVEDAVVEVLRSRQSLLLLDNCEHLLDPLSSIVDRVLGAAAGISIVATSREHFALPGETLWPVEPLAVTVDDTLSLEQLRHVPAVELFLDRAMAADPTFAFDDTTAPAVIEICSRLDGIPLAIELAAARIRALGVVEMAARLDERFRLLKGVRRGVDPRHQALQDAVRWSYDLLDESEQRLFAELSVFAGQFDLAAAEAVCAAGTGVDVLDSLPRLAERSMVGLRGSTHGTRYELLETLRTYGRSRLDDDDSVALFDRHAKYYADLVDAVALGLGTEGEPQAMRTAADAFADLRAAQRFSAQVGDVERTLRLTTSIREYAMRAMRYEALTWADRAVAIPSAQEHELYPTVRGIQAYAAWVRGEFATALELAAEVSTVEAERALEPSGLAERVRANVLFAQGDLADGLEETGRQLELAEASGDRSRLTHACYMRSVAMSSLSEPEAALEMADRALDVGRSTGSPTDLASGWVALGFARHEGSADSLEAFIESDRVARLANNRWMSAFARTESSWLLLSHGDPDGGCEGLADVVDIWYRAGDWSQQWHTLTRCVVALTTIGQPELATQVIGAVEARATMGAPPVMALLRDRVLEMADDLQGDLGADRYGELYTAGVELPVAELVHRTRSALLGRL